MNFKEFVKITRPIIGGKSNISTYVKTLFDAILTNEGKDILKDYSDATFKSYANGFTSITKISMAMAPHIDPIEFSSFIMNTEEPTQIELCNIFSEYLPNINKLNVGDEIAELFANIIKEAAVAQRTKRNPKKSKNHNNQQDDRQLVKFGEFQISTEEFDLLKQFTHDFDKILQYCIDTDFTIGFKLELTDIIRLTLNSWNYKHLTFRTQPLRRIIIDVYNSLSELATLISEPPQYWEYNYNCDLVQPYLIQSYKENKDDYIKNHDWFNEILRPTSVKIRYKLRDFYRELHPDDFKDLPSFEDCYEDWLKEHMT